ncbi:MAG: chloride channel protein [Planctomycetota bacterium]
MENKSPPLSNTRRFARALSPSGRWALLAVIVGLFVGLACITLEFLTQAVGAVALSWLAGYTRPGAAAEHTFFESLSSNPSILSFSPWWLVAIMILGGLVSGFLVFRYAPETAGAGTDASVDAFHNQKGAIRARVIAVKTLASAVTLGTGGSGGREGPIVQIAAAMGSLLADRLHLSTRDRRILLAAGMGAGVGAMFRAPLAGAIFAGEILYSDADIEADVLVPSAVASIVAYSVYTQSIPAEARFQPIFGDALQHSFASPLELPLYLVLACVVFLLAAAYSSVFHRMTTALERLPGPAALRPAVGAGLAGLIGIAAYYLFGGDANLLAVLGTGYGTLQLALVGDPSLTIGILVTIATLKIFTSAFSIGSGGSGGAFGPSMVIGGCAGSAFGLMAQAWMPGLVPHPETYGVVGMAGFFAGVARAPISTIIMVRELTGDFGLLVPTMLVCTFTFLASARWRLYRNQVPTRLESPAHRGDFLVDVLEGLSVRDVYQTSETMLMIDEAETLDEIVHHLAESHQHYFPVIDRAGRMVGIFTDEDVRVYLYDETIWQLANAGDVMSSPFEFVLPGDDLNIAMQKFMAKGLDELPVMDADDPARLLGFITRKGMIAAYNRRIVEHRKLVE